MDEYISELRSRQDKGSRLQLDILRALVVFGGSLWLSEVPSAIERLYLGRLPVLQLDMESVERAVSSLAAKGLVKAEERIRATEREGGERDRLIILADEKVRVSLTSDEVINEYYLSLSSELNTLRKS
ncbi:hypothetical protein [Infirmifilum sp. NZ]|uniref:hypothetical protein n=1 Tax=Infirmifilum sp. NZ TaxID=2926850 RepID=UPI0027A72D65|nr:hypothetical protein [Infirmifilum sp. NZ]UNQ72927.1 hypothetical protein MOV14_07390 [Infirmifilum sp. NZ]